MFSFGKKSKNFVKIPLDVTGGLYVSPMPFGPYDTGNTLLKAYKKSGIDVAVVLVTDEEMQKKTKRDLIAAYTKARIKPIRFPVVDYTCPQLDGVSELVDELSGYLLAGARMVVHCNAGVGRTGVIACCIVQNLMKVSAQEAIDYVKKHMMINMTSEQTRLVKRFDPTELKPVPNQSAPADQ